MLATKRPAANISCIYSGRELVYQGIKKCISLSLKSRILQIQLCLIHRGFRKKRTDFNFPIVNFPFMCSNIPTAPAYRICTFPFIRYPTVCGSYHDIFVLRFTAWVRSSFLASSNPISKIS
jgi:hypothetical protein